GSRTGAEAKIASAETRPDTWQTLLDIVPKNPFAALAQTKMLQVVFASLLIGIALTRIDRDKARAVIGFCDAMTDVIIQIVHWVLMLAPIAVFALIVEVVADVGIDVLGSLIKYSLTVVAGLAIMIFIVYPTALKLFTPVGYGRFFRAISPAQLLAFSSASSGATLPVTMDCCEQRLGLSEEVTSFVIPLGATVNMDGTALYQGVAAVFIAQLFGIDLSLMDQLTIILTATMASIGTAAVPGAGIIMLIIVLQTLDFPDYAVAGGIAVILAVDRILDMCRTACNVTGDCMVATVVAAGEGAIETRGGRAV
ncbi:MAG TPA: dicarboxylate/amino acid:cation symporter, partial [Phycisphaerales bacterium]|nr:dicarboxylate/amino acid:cation symporter [Phycisphaerales bacterium]